MTQSRRKEFIIFTAIGILLLIILTTIYFYKQPKPVHKQLPENKYEHCNQLTNASAPIEPANVIADKNEIQLLHAQTNGLKKPFLSNEDFDSTYQRLVDKYELVELKDCRLYRLKSLKHSHPYLIPEAVSMLDEIAIRFQEKLKEKKIGHYAFLLTSILRTVETQQKLSKRNGNATENTAHYYGTTVDISYKDFYNLDNDSIEPKWEVIQELMKTLLEMRKECKLLAVKERKQSCFHITVVCCKPAARKEEDNQTL